MKSTYTPLILTSALGLFLAGCNTPAKNTATKPSDTKYIYLPTETGSRIQRRVAVNPDGTVSPASSSVIKANQDAAQELQRRGTTGGRSGN